MKTQLRILFLITLTSCGQQQKSDKEARGWVDKAIKEVETLKNQTPPSIDYSIGELTFNFSNLTDPYDLGLYQRLEVLVEGDVQVTIEEKYLELEGQNFELSTNFLFNTDSYSIYLIPANNRPEPNFYFFLKLVGNKIELIGKTEALTKEMFGDIDNDGFLEIGGFNAHCQGLTMEDFNDPNFCLDNFRVFEIRDSIARDTLTEIEELKKIKKASLQQWLKNHSCPAR